MDGRNAPCKGCERRHPGCQTDECPDWKPWHEWMREQKTKIFRKRWLDDACRKIGMKKPRESHTARVFQNKSHRKERPNGSRLEMEQEATSERIRKEIREREGRD